MIKIIQELCTGCMKCKCPFHALVMENSKMSINAACRNCSACIKSCPNNAIIEEVYTQPKLDKSKYSGVMVYAEHNDGILQPVTFELIGKATELANEISQNVSCVYIGAKPNDSEFDKLLKLGVKDVYAYTHEDLRYFKSDVYASVFYDCITKFNPTTVLVGATTVGRSLAPRVATRCRTGLTADCTGLSMKPNTDLVQTRPAFGGNIMAQIITSNHRPQFATVRARVMETPREVKPIGKVMHMPVTPEMLLTKIVLDNIQKKEMPEGIEFAETLVVAGNAVKKPAEMNMLSELAALLGGRVGATRPVVEAGLAGHLKQIGLSGRSVRPKLIITCGVSGSVQFMAGMKSSEYIFAINKNPDAPIMKIAHYAAVGDMYEIVPKLINRLKG